MKRLARQILFPVSFEIIMLNLCIPTTLDQAISHDVHKQRTLYPIIYPECVFISDLFIS